MIFGKNAHLLSYFRNMKKSLKNDLSGGEEKIFCTVLDNVQYRNESIKICRIIKYIYKTFSYKICWSVTPTTNYYLYKLTSINIFRTSAVATALVGKPIFIWTWYSAYPLIFRYI